MADSESESLEIPSPLTREQYQNRIESLQQQIRVMKIELETCKMRVKTLQEENKELKRASVSIQAKAEQEEEYISNTLLKQIQALKKEKEILALNYEQEEECLTNDLSRKLNQLRQEKVQLEETLEKEQEALVNKLMRKIERLEAETLTKQDTLEQLRREKIELENTLEQEQEALVNRLWKRMDKLEAEKRMLQEKLDQPPSTPPSPSNVNNGDTAANLALHIKHLRNEVSKLKMQLINTHQEHSEKMARYAIEEKNIRDENVRLQRRLQMETERREALCRHLSESESSLEMDEERHFNEMSSQGQMIPRSRTMSSPIPYNPSTGSRPLSPGFAHNSYRESFSPSSPINRCSYCNQPLPISGSLPNDSPPSTQSISFSGLLGAYKGKPQVTERFIKPNAPPPKPPPSPLSPSPPTGMDC